MEDLQLCGWATASMTRGEVEAVNRAVDGHLGAVTVTTCQRIEVLSEGGLCTSAGHLRQRGRDALQHLAEVAAGLHSVVLGEPQVLGQVRAGLADAPAAWGRYTGAALAAARELRRREHFAMHSGHLLDRGLAALEMAPAGRLLVLGAGPMGRLIAARGLELGFAEVLVASRTVPTTSPAGALHVPLEAVARLAPVRLIVGCLGAAAPELHPLDLPATDALFDLGTPRNFGADHRVALVALGDLLNDPDPAMAVRRQELAARLGHLLDRRLEMASRDADSTIGMLRQEIERVRSHEVARIQKLHPEIPAGTADAITQALVNKLFHLPAERLRNLDDGALRDRLVDLFLRDEGDHAGRGGGPRDLAAAAPR